VQTPGRDRFGPGCLCCDARPATKTFALGIQAVAGEESGDKAFASSVYPKITALDSSRGKPEKFARRCLEAVIRVQAARKEHGLPPTCS